MSKSISLICALITTFIWGTAFIAQDTGMDNIGPLTFNAARFFVGFVTVLPIALLVERGKIIENINLDKKLFFKYLFLMSLSLFFGTYLQQTSLLYTNIANAAFFTVFYVPLVPIILFIIYKIKVHWSIWPSILLCIIGVYFLSDFSNSEILIGDSLVILCSVFWALHIIFAGKFMEKFDIPIFFAALQAILVGMYSLLFALLFEEINLTNILLENYSIIYAGFLSGGIAFTLQMYAQKNIEEAPAAIIYSLEGVFAALAGWIILNQMLDFSNILGCFIILIAVILSQITPSFKKLTVRDNK
ncbi:DMT family transporter [Candidatus Pelagibacter sp.]|jgi:drug/metabolite transporter (DMT)-like permease|nr:DMT family transporter [Candidatus Pelagibacter sp.]MDC3066189.1 DMT family transporter [Candidatus Pelagibacter sp.]|tara:strand:- start:4804 stop:5709 length:906 start_codon:yes stop_codon:yes gene_type:complete